METTTLTKVTVARTNSQAVEVGLVNGGTVKDALESAGLRVKATEQIRVNGSEASEGTVLQAGDRVVLVRNIEGGN